MRVQGRPERTIRLADEGVVRLLDQRALPHRVVWEDVKSCDGIVEAIRDMHVRGAPLIGAAAAYGMHLARLAGEDLDDAARRLLASRPTAVDLRTAVEGALAAGATRRFAETYADESAAMCRAIGEHGARLLEPLARAGRPLRILTHCNAGWLACVDRGTALAPIYELHERGVPLHVYVDETRPRNQGAALTSWELREEGVPHTVVADNAGGHLMQQGLVDAVIVGADRIAANGDAANKIGTYLKALAARDNGVPFFVAAPSTTIDWRLAEGARIPIEERGEDEIHFVTGADDAGDVRRVRVTPTGVRAANPAFDVTPARIVTRLVTERGSCEPAHLGSLYARA